MSATKPNIFWTPEEHDAVARSAMDEHGYSLSEWKVGLFPGLDAAQRKVMPPEKWRKLFGGKSVVKLKQAMLKLRAEKGLPFENMDATLIPGASKYKKPRKLTTRKVDISKEMAEIETGSRMNGVDMDAVHTVPKPTLQTLREELATKVAKIKTKTPKPAPVVEAFEPVKPDLSAVAASPLIREVFDPELLKDKISTFLAEALVDTVKKLFTNGDIARILNSLQHGRIPDVISEPFRQAQQVTEVAVPKPNSKKRVLVCGMLKHQQNQLTKDFPNLHLKFWYAENSGEGLSTLKEKAATSDMVLFKMDQTSHSAVDAVASMKVDYKRIIGSVTSMHNALALIA